MNKTKQAAEASGTLVYCGPTIHGVAQQWTCYTNGLTSGLAALAAEDRAVAGLVLPLEQLPDARKQITYKYGRIYTLYKRVQAGLAEKAKAEKTKQEV